MKGIVIGDIHLGVIYKGIDFNERIWKCLDRIFYEILTTKIKFVVLLGDILHNIQYSTDTLILIITFLNNLETLGIPVFVIAGNHDRKKLVQDTKELFDLLKVLRFDNIKFIHNELQIREWKKDIAFLFIPHLIKSDIPEQSESSVQEYLDNQVKHILRISNKHSIYVFSHLAMGGAKVGSENEMLAGKDLEIPKLLLKKRQIKKIFNGHLHLSQEIGKVMMPGSVESFRFGETDRRFYLEVEV